MLKLFGREGNKKAYWVASVTLSFPKHAKSNLKSQKNLFKPIKKHPEPVKEHE